MDTITLTAIVGEDRRLVIDLPPDMPTGPIKLTIEPEEPKQELTREEVRAILLAAGALSTATYVSEGTERLSDEEILRLGTLPPGARPSHELIDEDRGPR